MPGQIFISYAHDDELYVGLFKRRLQATYDIWTDRNIGPGQEWKESIDSAIRKSFAVLVILTPESSKSPYVTYEWSYAFGMGRRLITVLLEKTEGFHPRLENLQYIDFSNHTLKATITGNQNLSPQAVDNLVDTLSMGWDWTKLTDALAEEELEFRKSAGTEIAMMLLQDGVTKIQNRDYQNALHTLQEAVRFAPQHQLDDIHFQMALAYKALKDMALAEDHLLKALEQNKQHAPAMALLGDLYRRQAVAVEETDREKWEHLLEKAKVYFDDALALQPHLLDENNESVYASLGGVLKRLDRIKEAIAAYHKATEYRGTSYPYNNLGLLYMHENQIDAMRADFRLVCYLATNKINQQDTIDAWAFNDLMVSQIVLGQVDDARSTLETILAIPPSYALQRLLDTLETDMANLPGATPEALAFVGETVQAIKTRVG